MSAETERLQQIVIVEAIPLPAIRRLSCGMVPASCGFYEYKGGSDHICNRRIPSDQPVLDENQNDLKKLQQAMNPGGEPIAPMVLCGVIINR